MSQIDAARDEARSTIEHHGVESIPEADRSSRPLNLLTNLTGANLNIGAILVGYIPATLGMSWWETFSAIVIGCAIGAVILSPTALLGPRTGTTGPVSSGAYFGVIGRLNGTLISLVASIGYFALTVWTGGQVVVYGAHELFGTPDDTGALAISYALMSALCAFTAIVGHDYLVRIGRWLIPTAGGLMLVGFVVYAGHFQTKQLLPSYALGGFWPTWTLAATIAAASVFGYGIYVNDWSRYISRRKHSDIAVAGATGIGGFVGVVLPLLFGAYTAFAIGSLDAEYLSGLMGITPAVFIVALILIGFGGSLGQGALCLYGSGLDLASVVRRIRRPTATIILSAVSVVFVYLGGLVWNMENTVTTVVTILGVFVAAWTSVVLVGFFSKRDNLDADDLQVFNEGRRGGRYWYWSGVNPAGLLAWLIGSGIGLLCYSGPLYTGPWSMLAGGVDLSWLSAGVIAALLYPLLELLTPARSAARVSGVVSLSPQPASDPSRAR